MTAEGTPQQSSQRSRWVFTLNYDENTNYKEHLLKDEFKIRRAVFGYERGPQTGTKHIQGYLELDRSYRIVHVKGVISAKMVKIVKFLFFAQKVSSGMEALRPKFLGG